MSKDSVNTEHEQGIIEAIVEHKIMSFSSIFGYYTKCSRATAYNHGLDKLDSIKEAINSNKRHSVQSMLKKWIDSDNATLQIAAMRMICEPDERQSLSQSYVDHSTKGEPLPAPLIVFPKDEQV
jgi:hypothetical protein